MKRKIALCLALMIAMMSLGAGALAATIKTNTSNGVVNLRSQGSAKKPQGFPDTVESLRTYFRNVLLHG